MARSRNYRAEYARRVARAKAEGYRSYGQKRVVRHRAKAQGLPPPPPPNAPRRRQERYARGLRLRREAPIARLLHYYANYIDDDNREAVVEAMLHMVQEGDEDYGPDSWHYRLFVELLNYMDANEWEGHYPTGVRAYGMDSAAS
jgi:hypothetical protein